MGQNPSKYPTAVIQPQQQPVLYPVDPYQQRVAYMQSSRPMPQGPAQVIVNGPPTGGGFVYPPQVRPGPGQLPRRFDVLPPGFEQDMRNMEQDFWDDNGPMLPNLGRPQPVGPWGPQNAYPPGPSRLPRQRGVAGRMIDNMRQNGMDANFMGGMQPGANQYQQPVATPTPNVRTVTTYVDEPRGYVPPPAQTTSYQTQPAQLPSQSIQPTILIYDPTTGQMTQQGAPSQGAPQVITVPQTQQTPQFITIPQQGTQQQAAPQIITIPQGGQPQQAYTVPQMPTNIPGMPNISWGMPQQQAAPQPIVIPGQYSGGANLYTGYQQQ